MTRALEFAPCDACLYWPAKPPLCKGCEHNRAVIEALLASTTPRDQAAALAKAEAILGRPG